MFPYLDHKPIDCSARFFERKALLAPHWRSTLSNNISRPLHQTKARFLKLLLPLFKISKQCKKYHELFKTFDNSWSLWRVNMNDEVRDIWDYLKWCYNGHSMGLKVSVKAEVKQLDLKLWSLCFNNVEYKPVALTLNDLIEWISVLRHHCDRFRHKLSYEPSSDLDCFHLSAVFLLWCFILKGLKVMPLPVLVLQLI